MLCGFVSTSGSVWTIQLDANISADDLNNTECTIVVGAWSIVIYSTLGSRTLEGVRPTSHEHQWYARSLAAPTGAHAGVQPWVGALLAERRRFPPALQSEGVVGT
jgi:hypothetical protein